MARAFSKILYCSISQIFILPVGLFCEMCIMCIYIADSVADSAKEPASPPRKEVPSVVQCGGVRRCALQCIAVPRGVFKCDAV